jgi:putative tricarboxylic transport membrane protein
VTRDFARSGDFWSGVALAALGAWIVSEARGWVYMAEEGPGPGFFPLWYGGAMIVLSLVLVAGAVLKPGAGKAVKWADVGRAITCWIAFVAAIVLMPWSGFAISFALLVWFIVRVMAAQSHAKAITLALSFAAGFYLLFEIGLELSLPRGVLF